MMAYLVTDYIVTTYDRKHMCLRQSRNKDASVFDGRCIHEVLEYRFSFVGIERLVAVEGNHLSPINVILRPLLLQKSLERILLVIHFVA